MPDQIPVYNSGTNEKGIEKTTVNRRCMSRS